jgi:pimeloyl-ACP methyl ester carboxylesterase
MVLDGALDPSLSIKDQNLTQMLGFEEALDAFIQDCSTRKDCPLPKKLSDARTAFTTLFESAAQSPLMTQGDRVATESIVVLGTAYALYDNETGWPQLRAALRQAKNNEGTAFLKLVDEYSSRNADGTYVNNEADAELVIDCLDWQDPRSIAQIQIDAKEFLKRAPVFGPYFSYNSLACKYFAPATRATSMQTTNKITSINSSPILIIGTRRDPATPYVMAQSLHQIIKGSRLISLDADGHTGHGRGSKCVDDAVNAYFLRGTLPTKNLNCNP